MVSDKVLTPESQNLGEHIARHLANTTYDDIPKQVREHTKIGILDTIAAAIAGYISPVARRVADQVIEWGGHEESTVWAYGGKISAPQAALINGMLVHTLDMDAVHDDAIVHGFTSVVPAAITTAEAVGATGKDLITAVAVGTDFALRMGLACGFYRGFILTATLGGFGAAAAASKALRLDAKQTVNTLGIYYSQTAGNRQPFVDATSATRYQPGFSARNGVLSAFFAKKGLSGAPGFLDGRFGYFNLYFEGEVADTNALLDGLGEHYENLNISFKPYPSCRGAHAPVDAVLKIMHTLGVQPEQVEEILVRTPTSSLFGLIGRPFQLKPDPHVNAQYSIPYAVANAMIRGKFFVDDLHEVAIRDQAVLNMAERVTVTPTFDARNKKALTPVEVDVRVVDGAVYSERVVHSKGHPKNPMSHDELVEKFRNTAEAAGIERIIANVDRITDLIGHLEDLSDVAELAALLGC
jgi:2-methylcitrate dehydratase PrpD